MGADKRSKRSLSKRETATDASAEVRPVADAGNQHEFARLTEPYRRELQVHCYRMLGSLEDAEDTVQETLFRAWRQLHSFEGRASVRTWLYKIATNACLDALDKRRRRLLPQSLHAAADPTEPVKPPTVETVWLEPYPDELLPDAAHSPESHYIARESISLAFLAALQALPARQRAVLILRDVLDWHAAEVAVLLEMSVPAVNSALHRARVTLSRQYPPHVRDMTALPTDSAVQAVLARYVRAWETASVPDLIELLREDATFSMPPSPSWYQGRAAIQTILRTVVFGEKDCQWRLHPIGANGQPAFIVNRGKKAGSGSETFGIQVVSIEPGSNRITEAMTFTGPSVIKRFLASRAVWAGAGPQDKH